MSVDADGADAVDLPTTPPFRTGVTVLDELAVYGAERPTPSLESYERGPVRRWETRAYLVAILEVELQDRAAQTFSAPIRVGLYATACGAHTIRVDEASFDHSICEPVDRLRTANTDVRAHFAGIVRQTHLPWRTQQ